MAQAPKYTPSTSFYDDSRNNAGGRETVRTDRLDAELGAIEITADALCENLELIQRDDGKLRDQIVEPYALSVTTRAYIQGSRFTPRGQWASSVLYAVGDLIDYLGDAYVCAIVHTSTSFAADYASGRWQVFTTVPGSSDVDFTPTATISATNVQAAIVEVEQEAKASINPLLATLYGAL